MLNLNPRVHFSSDFYLVTKTPVDSQFGRSLKLRENPLDFPSHRVFKLTNIPLASCFARDNKLTSLEVLGLLESRLLLFF